MFRYLKYMWYRLIGRTQAAADALAGNRHVMEAAFNKSIDVSKERFHTVKESVAQLMGIEATRISEIKSLNEQEVKLTKVKEGAKVAMQKRINTLSASGLTKEQIQVDPEFIKHNSAFKDASSTLEQVESRRREKEADLKEKQGQIATFKAELQKMQRAIEKLKEEKQETLADVAIAHQAEAINNVLSGISQDSTDKDLEAVRAARNSAKQKAKISAELAGNDASISENEYLQNADASAADRELDEVLNWGNADASTTTPLQDAKVNE